jgi:hypothetical protein
MHHHESDDWTLNRIWVLEVGERLSWPVTGIVLFLNSYSEGRYPLCYACHGMRDDATVLSPRADRLAAKWERF